MNARWGTERSVRFAALLLLAALAACGGGKPAAPAHADDAYQQAAYRVFERYTREKTTFDTEHITMRSIRATATRQHAALKHVADGLAALSPPPRLKRLHDDAVSGFRKEAAIYASLEGNAATATSVKELRFVMYVEGTRLADIRDEVDAAAERYLKALG